MVNVKELKKELKEELRKIKAFKESMTESELIFFKKRSKTISNYLKQIKRKIAELEQEILEKRKIGGLEFDEDRFVETKSKKEEVEMGFDDRFVKTISKQTAEQIKATQEMTESINRQVREYENEGYERYEKEKDDLQELKPIKESEEKELKETKPEDEGKMGFGVDYEKAKPQKISLNLNMNELPDDKSKTDLNQKLESIEKPKEKIVKNDDNYEYEKVIKNDLAKKKLIF